MFKRYASLAAALFGVAAIFGQGTLPSLLTRHCQTLQEAGSLTASVTVQPSGGAPESYRLTYSKPNLLKIETPSGYLLSDGQNVYEYTKSSNSYSSSPAESLAKTAEREEVFAWAAFFAKEPLKAFRSAHVGAKRTLKGNAVTELMATLGGNREGEVTLFIDDKLGIARGFMLKEGEKRWTVLASEIQIGSAKAASEFAFAPPEGVKKAEEIKPKSGYADVQALLSARCMPCHSPGQMSGGIVLSSYDGVFRVVTPRDPAGSRIVSAIKGLNGDRMPKGRTPLSDQEIAAIEEWIANGAKR
jgi:outer membrane lipoprotein-sorting protein